MDGSFFETLNWDENHVKQVARLLKPGGVFMFQPCLFGGTFTLSDEEAPIISREDLEREWKEDAEQKDSRVFCHTAIFFSDLAAYVRMGYGSVDKGGRDQIFREVKEAYKRVVFADMERRLRSIFASVTYERDGKLPFSTYSPLENGVFICTK